jgi:hypothetical protein
MRLFSIRNKGRGVIPFGSAVFRHKRLGALPPLRSAKLPRDI